MEFNTKFAAPEKQAVACVAAGIFESRRLSQAADALDKASRGQIREFIRSGDMDGKSGATRLLYRVRGVAADRVLLVGLGREKEFGERGYRDCTRAAFSAILGTGAREASLYLTELQVPGREAAWKARQLVLAAADAGYRFDRMKSKKVEAKQLAQVLISAVSKRDAADLNRGLLEGRAISAGMALARDLGNLPAEVAVGARGVAVGVAGENEFLSCLVVLS